MTTYIHARYCMTGGANIPCRPEFSEFAVWRDTPGVKGGWAWATHGDLDAPEQMLSGASTGHEHDPGVVFVYPTYCAR